MAAKRKSLVVTPADEFSDPLQAILSNTEVALLLLCSGNPDVDKIKAALRDVVSEVRRVRQMIRGGIDVLRATELPIEGNLQTSGKLRVSFGPK